MLPSLSTSKSSKVTSLQDFDVGLDGFAVGSAMGFAVGFDVGSDAEGFVVGFNVGSNAEGFNKVAGLVLVTKA